MSDVDRDGRADLVTGAAGEDGHGAVTTLRGSASGLTTGSARFIAARDVALTGMGHFAWAIAR
ncbi:hypothetical protein [Streptomyces sp. NPDC001781]